MELPLDSYERNDAAGVSGAPKSPIFVVEDDADIARLIAHNLRASGFSVQSFVSGASVISEALREMPSLFLLDVMLPGTDGFELCRHIRQTPALSAVPIIFLTAKSSESDRVKGLELGGDDYITKPFSPREMVARVRSVLRGLSQDSEPEEVMRLRRAGHSLVFDDGAGAGAHRPDYRARIPAAGISGHASRARPDARSTARCGLERNSLRHAAINRRLHSAAAREN